MTSQSSRRSFLGLSALGLAAAVAPNELIGPAAAMTGLGNETSKTNLDQGPDKIGREISI